MFLSYQNKTLITQPIITCFNVYERWMLVLILSSEPIYIGTARTSFMLVSITLTVFNRNIVCKIERGIIDIGSN